MKRPSMNRMTTSPIPVPRTRRNHDIRVLSSLPAGKMVPLAAIPLLREDSGSGSMRLTFEMMETAEILMNAINVDVKAYLVPNLAFPRFSGMDELNRSYEGIPNQEGGPVTPYFEFEAAGPHGSNKIHLHMGKHARPTQMVNTAYVEAYNEIWNFRAKNRSPDITLREKGDKTLAPAFWKHTGFNHIVPDFDQAIIDGEVPLNVVGSTLSVTGPLPGGAARVGVSAGSALRFHPGDGTGGTARTVFMRPGNALSYGSPATAADTNITGISGLEVKFDDVVAELQENGITVSLSNIELARKTQAFAALRQQYTGHSDEYIIDLLMDGIQIPEQMWRHPMLLGQAETIFGMAKRYASDSGNLTESVVSGATFVDLRINVPRVNCGGIIMVVAEITPEQLFERQKDPYLHIGGLDDLPQYLRDELDPEKVVVVPNDYVDLDHDTPNATFGYAPLNHEWNHTAPGIGGRFFRPEVDAGFDEDRQRIWAVETQNPVLSEDFYLCTNMHTKPFVVTNQDPFEVVVRGNAVIAGNTVFGGLLVEANGDYDAVLANAPQERIEK